MVWRCGCIAVATVLSVAQLCVGQNIQLSLRGRVSNLIELNCVAATTVRDRWTFWIDEQSNPLYSYTIKGQDSLSITILVTLTPENEGYYYCGLRGETSNPKGPFTANPQSTNHTVVSLYRVGMDGSSLLLPNPVPLPAGNTSQYYSITWINGTSFTLDMSSSKYSLTQNGSLNVHELEEIDSGQYSLKINVTNPVANSFFVYMNSSYRIHVQDMSRIIEGPKNTTKFGTDGPESLTCQATGYPEVSIQWSHNGQIIDRDNSKYNISSNSSIDNTISSILIIRTLNETDNGNVTCTAQISGCDVDKSYDNCESSTFPNNVSSFVSVFTTSFNYDVTVLNGGNLQLKIDQEGMLIPQPVRVYIKYINEVETEEKELPSTQINMDLVILLYISRNHIPYERFRIRVALGTSTGNSNLYKAPSRDRIIDVNQVDNPCNFTPWIAVIITAGIILTLIFAIGLIVAMIMVKQKRKHRHEMKKELVHMLPPENLDNLLREYFPKCFRSTDIAADSSNDVALPPEPTQVRDWLETTDTLLLGIQDRNKKRALITVLANTVKTLEWYKT